MGYVGTYFIEEFEKTKREFEKKYGWTFPDPDSEKYLDYVRKMRENLLALKDFYIQENRRMKQSWLQHPGVSRPPETPQQLEQKLDEIDKAIAFWEKKEEEYLVRHMSFFSQLKWNFNKNWEEMREKRRKKVEAASKNPPGGAGG